MAITITLTEDQLLEGLRQLSPDQREALWKRIAPPSVETAEEISGAMEPRYREAAKERGLDWDAMSDDDKHWFVTELDQRARGIR